MYQSIASPVTNERTAGLRIGIRRVSMAVAAFFLRERTRRHLQAMTDRQLADIGIARDQIGAVVKGRYTRHPTVGRASR
jgi:uncharacterized protein YjiS (DUF1127 family)